MVEILLATYNGEKYLRKQLDSLLAQDYRNFKITIRDDGSTDGTREIIDMYLESSPEKVSLLETKTEYKSVRNNFSELLRNATGDYIAFCDQDDIWDKQKLTKEMNTMVRVESAAGGRMPVLIHSDLSVVDEMLNPIAPSYMAYANIKPEKFTLKRSLAESCMKSCTVIINAPMLALCKYVPDNAISLDWWLTINAAAFCKIGYVKEQLVKYRQHGGNFSGAKPGSSLAMLKNSKEIRNMKFETQKSYYQAQEFMDKNPKGLTPEKLAIVKKYAELVNKNGFMRAIGVLFGGYSKKGLVKTIAQLINA